MSTVDQLGRALHHLGVSNPDLVAGELVRQGWRKEEPYIPEKPKIQVHINNNYDAFDRIQALNPRRQRLRNGD